MAQEILSTFAAEIGSVTLTPDRNGGRFDIYINGELIWSRHELGRFPDVKELKQRVLDHISPGRSLGHSDIKPTD